MDSSKKKNIYYVRSVKLSSILNKSYRKVSTNAAVSGVVFSVDGEVYNSSDQFKTDYAVSVDLVSLENLLITQNCDTIINSNEIVERLKLDKAKQEIVKAEAEVNALALKLKNLEKSLDEKTMIADLYKKMVEDLKQNMVLADNNVSNAKNELVLAQQKASKISKDCENQLCESSEPVKNQSNLSVINEVKKLSSDEVKKLGFEIN